MLTWILIVGLLIVAVGLIMIYNTLVRQRALVREAWSGITVQLRRRADLVPNLVATVEGYASHERAVLDQVTAHRSDATAAKGVGATAAADAAFTGMIGKLVAVAEAYPDLKADANFRQLQDELGDIEEELAGARRYYNATVRDLNTSVQSFPNNLVAGPFGFKEEEPYADDIPKLQIAPVVSFGGAKE